MGRHLMPFHEFTSLFCLDPECTGNNIPVEPVELVSASFERVEFHQVQEDNATVINRSERNRMPCSNQNPISEVRLIWRRYKLGNESKFAENICRIFEFRIHMKPSNCLGPYNLPMVADLLRKAIMAGQIVQFLF